MCFNPDTQVGNCQQALLDATRALEPALGLGLGLGLRLGLG